MSSSSAMAQPGELKPLRFSQPLNWPAGKPIQVKDLLSRLRAFADELLTLDPEEVDKLSLAPKARELANAQLLNHKDAGVKAWTAFCVVEVLRACAPEAPFTIIQSGVSLRIVSYPIHTC